MTAKVMGALRAPVDRAANPLAGRDLLDLTDIDNEIVELIDGWLERYDSDQTRSAYRNDLRRWLSWCEDHGVDLLAATGPHVTAFRTSPHAARLASGATASLATISRRVASLSSFYRHCVAMRAIDRNPVEFLRRSRSVSRAAIAGLDAREAELLLAAAAASSPRDFAIVSLMLNDGLRSAELLGLRRRHLEVGPDGWRLLVIREDGREERLVLHPDTAAALSKMAHKRSGAFLFHTHSGAPIRRQYVYQVVRRMARRAEITKTVSCQSLHQTYLAAQERPPHASSMIDVRRIDLGSRTVMDLQDDAREANAS